MRSARISALLLTLALLAAACGSGRTAVDKLEPGDCFDDQPGQEIQAVDLIDCSEPHDLEAFHVGNIGIAGTYPGEDALIDAGMEICEGPLFEAYVGRPYLESELYADFYLPTAAGWEQGDYEIICLIFAVDEEATETGELKTAKLTGSMRGSGR